MYSLDIKLLNISQSTELYEMFLNSDKEYSKYFIPFEISKKSISTILGSKIRDLYFGLFIKDKLCGLFMLRGFDEGYEIPSYGVWISPKYQNLGLAKLTLNFVITFCKINAIKKIMLKVHPENKIAKNIYEKMGFVRVGIDNKNKNIIYHKTL